MGFRDSPVTTPPPLSPLTLSHLLFSFYLSLSLSLCPFLPPLPLFSSTYISLQDIMRPLWTLYFSSVERIGTIVEIVENLVCAKRSRRLASSFNPFNLVIDNCYLYFST